MGHLDNTSVTDRPAATPPAPAPIDEPRDRGWIALLAIGVAAVATAVVVIVTSGSDEPSAAERANDAVRTPAATATATLDPALPAPANPTAPVGTAGTQAPGASAPAAGSSGASSGATTGLPAGWEPRTLQGVTFAVPPGATQPDLTDPGNADAPALFNWTGPSLGGEVYSHVSVWVQSASGAPTLGPEYRTITVPGAAQARMWTGPTGAEPATTTVDVHVLVGDRFINLVGTFAAGAAGEQAVRDLVASLSIG
jgi:hypothetical protein